MTGIRNRKLSRFSVYGVKLHISAGIGVFEFNPPVVIYPLPFKEKPTAYIRFVIGAGRSLTSNDLFEYRIPNRYEDTGSSLS